MFCSKCKFTSFDHLPKCPKCGFEWTKAREDLQLSWLQAAGYNWFQHAEKLYQFDMEPATATVQSPDFSFDPQDLPAGGGLPETHQALLIEEIDLADLSPDPTDASLQPDAAKAQSSAGSSHDELFTPSLDMPEADLAMVHSEVQAKADTASPPESEPSDQRSSEDVLAAWEIPDNMVAENLHRNANAVEAEPNASVLGDGAPPVDHEDAIPAADIEYDFSDAGTKGVIQDEAAPSDSQGAPLELDKNFGNRESD